MNGLLEVDGMNFPESLKWCEEYIDVAASAAGAQRFGKEREKAAKSLISLGWPTKKDELWRYTDLGPYQSKNLSLPVNGAGQIKTELLDKIPFPRMVFINGIYSDIHSDCAAFNGASVFRLGDPASLYNCSAALDKAFQLSNAKESFFLSMNGALFTDILGIVVTDSLERLHIVHLNNSSGAAILPRMLIIVDGGGKLGLSEYYFGEGEGYVFNEVTELFIGEGAQVELSSIVDEGSASFHISQIFVEQQSSANLSLNLLCKGGGSVRQESYISLEGEHCKAQVRGLSVMESSALSDNLVEMKHSKPNSRSSQKFKGVYSGSSAGVFRGTIIVEKEAIGTEAYQSHDSILLTDTASATTLPHLKIWADEVKCSHGATVGQLDDESIFYLRSRGIAEDEARKILLNGFMKDVLDEVECSVVKDNFVACKLEQSLLSGGK
ncbi:MAG: Fe-S cluster assembly protein SufD [Candidatus Dadabacteria bacterium]|nr:MAG: Fe-S cluster assembly protein SufD [Candidatus Dadabacteria bacterium]